MTEQPKTRLLLISDHIESPSGVGTQAKLLAEGLVKTGRYSVLNLGGAKAHRDYTPTQSPEFGTDLIVHPVNNYGDPNVIRTMLMNFRPDAVLFITDPRFYVWLWEMENEVRAVAPLLYWHVWDNNPAPEFNKPFYESTDFIGCISKLTHSVVEELGFAERAEYMPHAVPSDLFKRLPDERRSELRAQILGPNKDKFTIFWMNRNARRKKASDLLFGFREFIDTVDGVQGKVQLFLHTNPLDQEGPNLINVVERLGLQDDVILSSNFVSREQINDLINATDVTFNISNAEGFGLSVLESLMAGNPVVATMTGGMTEQLADKETGKLNGLLLRPAAVSCVGTQPVPYVFEDNVSHEQICDAMEYMYNMWNDGPEEFKAMGIEAAASARRRFDIDTMISKWDAAIQRTVVTHGERTTQLEVFEV